MPKITLYACDQCAQVIENSSNGVVIRGNMYDANTDTDERTDIVGNNFPVRCSDPLAPPNPKTHTFELAEIGETVLCLNCLLATIGLTKAEVRSSTR